MAKRALSRIGNFVEILGSAIAVSNAVEARRQPSVSDLRNLGIDPVQFRNIGRR